MAPGRNAQNTSPWWHIEIVREATHDGTTRPTPGKNPTNDPDASRTCCVAGRFSPSQSVSVEPATRAGFASSTTPAIRACSDVG